jgi:hypothetical protein
MNGYFFFFTFFFRSLWWYYGLNIQPWACIQVSCHLLELCLQPLFALVVPQIVLMVLPGTSLGQQSSASCVAGIKDVLHHAWLVY